MAFLKFGKKKKEESLDFPPMESMGPPDMAPAMPGSLADQVMGMKQQGYNNNQIVQALQGQGYNTQQVYDALNQASLSGNFGAAAQPEMGMPDYGQGYQQPQDHAQQYQQQSYQQPEAEAPNVDEERMQEIAEAIIDEKWDEFAGDIKKVIEWKDKTEDRIAKLEQQLIDLRLSMDSLTKSIMGKISSYDQNIVDVGTEVKAMEKVFQKILPTLTESVNKLDRMTKGNKEP